MFPRTGAEDTLGLKYTAHRRSEVSTAVPQGLRGKRCERLTTREIQRSLEKVTQRWLQALYIHEHHSRVRRNNVCRALLATNSHIGDLQTFLAYAPRFLPAGKTLIGILLTHSSAAFVGNVGGYSLFRTTLFLSLSRFLVSVLIVCERRSASFSRTLIKRCF